MLPSPAVPGSCLASFHFRWAIHPIRPVHPGLEMNEANEEGRTDSTFFGEGGRLQFENVITDLLS